MTYDTKQLKLLTDRLVADGCNLWTYDDTAAVAAVIAADYISDAKKQLGQPGRGLNVGDKVIYRRWSDLTSKIAANLVSVSEHIVVDVADTGAKLGPALAPLYVEIADAVTKTLTEADAGGTLIFDKVDGAVITLPAPVVGMEFHFKVDASVTSNAYKIITNAGTVFIKGGLSGFGGNGSTHVAISMNGSTTGGIIGTWFTLRCVSATQWQVVRGLNVTSGSAATPFATS